MPDNPHGDPGGLMVIIDSPTEMEVVAGKYLMGAPRQLVERTLAACNNTLPIWWTNAVDVAFDLTKIIPQRMWSKYVKKVQAEIVQVKPQKILCLGATALACVLDAPRPMPITKHHGRGFKHSSGAFVVSAYNPHKIIGCPPKLLGQEELFRDFCKAVQKIVANDEPIPEPEMALFIPETLEELINALSYLHTYEAISCDLETRPRLPGEAHERDSLNPHAGKIMSFGFGALMGPNSGYSVVIPERLLDAESTVGTLRDFFRSYQGTITFHNGKFDAKFIEAYLGSGWDVGNIEDTMLMAYVMDERAMSSSSSLGLKTQARIRYDATDYAMDFGQYYRNFFEGKKESVEKAEHEMHMYHALDLYYGIKLWYDLRDEAREEDPKLYDKLCRNILFKGSKLFSHVEYRGVLLDREYTMERSREVTDELNQHIEQLNELVGDRKFDVFSPAQVKQYVESFGVATQARKRGRDSDIEDPLGTRKDELLALVKTAPPELARTIPLILSIRQASKLNTTYFQSFLNKSAVTGRIHPDFRLAGTATGRLSCADPNLQNVPARIGALVRDCFVATPGHIFVQMDYSQLELRVLAYLAQDRIMADTFREGVDIHTRVAMEIFQCEASAVTKNMRMMAKNIDFGIVYGRGPKTIVEGPEMDKHVADGGKRWTISEAVQFINKFKKGFPAMSKWMDDVAKITMRKQYSESVFHRRRRFPLIPNNPRVIASIRRQAVNTPIQSAASDICLAAMTQLHETLPTGAHVLFSVHDSILFEIREDLVDAVVPIMKKTMETSHGLGDFVPFEVTAEKGTRWGSLKEFEVHYA